MERLQPGLPREEAIQLVVSISKAAYSSLLLDDLRTNFQGKETSLEPITLSEDTLSHLNVTKTRGGFGLGILRDGGKVDVPSALQESKDRKELEQQLVVLYKAAKNGEKIGGLLSDVRKILDRMGEDLLSRVNETPGPQYIDAKEFLQEVRQGCRALENGEMANNNRLQEFIKDGGSKGRTVQDVAKWMVMNGLWFAPGSASDQAAYRAIHSAMATHDIAVNTQFGETPKE